MTIKDLATRTGISDRMIINYETGKNDITLTNLKNISYALEVSISELIDEPQQPIPPKQKCENPECINRIERLEKMIDDLIDDKRRLKQENDELRKGGQSPGKRVAGGVGESSQAHQAAS